MEYLTFGEWLKARRLLLGYTLAEVAEIGGKPLSGPYISQLESSTIQKPGLRHIAGLVRALQIERGEFLDTLAAYTSPQEPAPPNTERVIRRQKRAERIPASTTWPADDEDYLPESLSDDTKQAVTVRGDCMAPKIEDGDTVIVDTTRQPELGKVIVWWGQGDWTLKRLRKRNGLLLLVPDNPAYEAIEIDPATSRILGVVIRVIKPEP